MTEFLANLLPLLLHLLHFILRPIYVLIHWRRPASIPPIKNPLLKLSAATLARKIRNGELCSQTVVEAYIERIKKVNPFINAVVEDRFEAAINDAKIYDAKLKAGEVTASTLEKEKPLYGVPVTIKESCSLKGLSYTIGTVPRRGMKASEDGPAVESLKNAGAIPLCVTNVAEMCSSLHTMNPLYGSTKNPYDTRKTPGGSSGGEGAMLGAGASIVGLGSDLTGSIRVPSLFNGIFGHKPTPGIVSIKGHFPMTDDPFFQKCLVLGPMARYMEDIYLTMKVLSSKCERDLLLDEPVDVKKLNVYYLENFGSFCGIRSTTSDIREKIREARQHLAQNGASVEEFPKFWIPEIFNLQMAVIGEMDLPELLLDYEHPERRKKPMLEYIKSLFGLSKYTVPLTMLEIIKTHHGFVSANKAEYYRRLKEDFYKRFNEALGDNGVLIYPTFSQPACISELQFYHLDSSVYSAVANILQLPATHVPMGLNKNGMPVGFQVIAAPYQDRLCLAVARELEQAFGGWIPPS